MKRAAAWVSLSLLLPGCGGQETAPEPAPGPIDTLVKTYCDCMFLGCHDDYHAFWGEDEQQAITNCRQEARLLPRRSPGDPQPGLECALLTCQRALDEDNPALCPQARGASTCSP
jgi:hypothetical protein